MHLMEDLWLLVDEEELRLDISMVKNQYHQQISMEKILRDLREHHMVKKEADVEFNTNIRLIGNYKNIRDLK